MNRPSILIAAAALFAIAAPVRAQRADTLRLALDEAVNIALRSSDEARLSAAQIDVAEAQVANARANGLPQLRINGSYTRTFASARAAAVGQIFNQPNTYVATASLSQSLFQGGRIVAGTRAAADVRAASRSSDDQTRADLTVQVQRAYLNVLYTRRAVAIQDTNVALSRARLAQVEQLQQAGRAARYDVLRARVELANLEPLLLQARNDYDLAVLELKRLLNIPIEQPVALTTALEPAGLAALADRFAADTVAPGTRGALRAAELTAQARHSAVTVARADLLPTVNLAYNSGLQAYPSIGTGFPTRMGDRSNAYCTPPGGTAICQNGGWFGDRSLVATVSIPVFDGLRAKSNIDLAQAQAHIADLQLRQERETIAIEVARARRELERARALFTARQQTSAEALEAFQLATLRFSRGLSTQLEVSDAQLALLVAETSEARATFDLYLATAELARALGRPIPFPPGAGTN